MNMSALKTPKDFVIRANSSCAASTILKLVSVAGRVAGFPIPGIDLNDMLGVSDASPSSAGAVGGEASYLDALEKQGRVAGSAASGLTSVIKKLEQGKADKAQLRQLAASLGADLDAVRRILASAKTRKTKKTL